jgi:hypothetical protein
MIADLKAEAPTRQYAEYKQMWEETQPYATCCDHAYCSQREFRKRLREVPDLAPFAKKVELLGAFMRVDEHGRRRNDKRPNHLIAALVVPSGIIVIDVTLHPEAFYISTNGYYRLRGDLTFTGSRRIAVDYRYSTNNYKKVAILSQWQNDTYREDYMPVTYKHALEVIKFPNARKTIPNTDIPNDKQIFLDAWFGDTAPADIPYVRTANGIFASASRVSISFLRKSIALTVTNEWYANNHRWVRNWILGNHMVTRGEAIQTMFILDLSNPLYLEKRAAFFGILCERNGLDRAEFRKMFLRVCRFLEIIPPE